MKRILLLIVILVSIVTDLVALQTPTATDIRQAASRNDWPTVERLALGILKKDKTDRTISLLLTMAQLRQGKAAEALASAHRTIALDSSMMQAWLLASESQTQLKQSEDAIATLKEAQQRFPDSLQPTWALGMAYARVGRCAEAIMPLEETMFRRPDVASLTQQLAQCYFATGRIAESVELYARAVERNPSDVNARLSYGEALMAHHDLDSAAYQFTEVIRQNPKMSNAYLALTGVLQELKKSEEALAVSRMLTMISPEDPMGWYNVGLLSLALGQTDTAIRVFKRAIALKPNYAEAYFNIALAYDERGFGEDATMAFKRSASISPLLAPAAYNTIAIMYRKTGRFQEAIAMHAQAIALQDSSAILHASQLNSYYEAQKCDSAKILILQELLRFPNDANILYASACCLIRTGDIDRAMVIAAKLDTLDPSLAEQLRLMIKI